MLWELSGGCPGVTGRQTHFVPQLGSMRDELLPTITAPTPKTNQHPEIKIGTDSEELGW